MQNLEQQRCKINQNCFELHNIQEVSNFFNPRLPFLEIEILDNIGPLLPKKNWEERPILL